MNNLISSLDQILITQRGYVFEPPINKKIVFISSGGLDSTIGVVRAIEEWDCVVYPLFVRRHARATKYEEASFNSVSEVYLKRYPKNYMSPKKIEIEVPPVDFKLGLTDIRLKKLGHAMRNANLQSLGVQYAVWLNDNRKFDIRTILAATVGDDFLPHSSIEAYRANTIAVCIDQNDWSWQIASPLIEPTLNSRPYFKRDNILWAKERNLPIEFTRTCINDCEISDGSCGECIDRLKAFKEAGIIDPINYQLKKI